MNGNWSLTFSLEGEDAILVNCPGELLREFLATGPQTELTQHIGVGAATISRTLNGRTAVTMDLSS